MQDLFVNIIFLFSDKFAVLHLTWFVPVQRIVEIQEQMLPFCSGITVTLSISSFHQFQKTIHFSMINSPG